MTTVGATHAPDSIDIGWSSVSFQLAPMADSLVIEHLNGGQTAIRVPGAAVCTSGIRRVTGFAASPTPAQLVDGDFGLPLTKS
jgi:hypothetical protein